MPARNGLLPAKVGLACRRVINPFNGNKVQEYWFIVIELTNETLVNFVPISNSSTVQRLKRLGYPVVDEQTLELPATTV